MGDRASDGAKPSVGVHPAAVERLRRVAGLTVERHDGVPSDHLADSARRVGHCLSMAHTLASIPCPVHRPDRDVPGAAGSRPVPAAGSACILGNSEAEARACDLALLLAVGPGGSQDVGRPQLRDPVARPEVGSVAPAYIEALAAAANAVYYCRRLQHPNRRCWFDPQGRGGDVCGRLLSIVHDLRVPAI